jgi:hypothetical protein
MDAPSRSPRLAAAGLTAALALLACGLGTTARTGETITDTQSVDRGGATSAAVALEFSAGELRVWGGSDGLMDASFRYNVSEWEPVVDYAVQGAVGNLRVRHSGSDTLPVGDPVNEWDIQLEDGVPMDLEISMGAGISDLQLADLDLTSVTIDSGASSTNVNLAGAWEHDLQASITGGVGELTVDLPSEMGVRVIVDTGIGSVTTSGLSRDGEAYVNDAYGSASYTLTLDLSVGVGAVTLRVP